MFNGDIVIVVLREKNNIDREKHWKGVKGSLQVLQILGNWPESHALPGGSGFAARRQRRGNGSAWQLDTGMVLGVVTVVVGISRLDSVIFGEI